MGKIKLEKIDIPPCGNHLVFNVGINGVQTRVVLDTGASRSVLDLEYLYEIVPELNVKEEDISSAGVGASDLKSYTAVLDTISIGDHSISSFEIAVMDLTHVKSSYQQIDEGLVYGVVGGDLLLKYNALIDYSDQSLTLRFDH